MNTQIPYFMNNQNPGINNNLSLEIEKIINKINRLEKSIRILENKVINLELDKNNNQNNYFKDDPTDMYII